MRQLLGGKGAGLAEMTNAGLPVPPGFTITTEACNAYYEAGKAVARRAVGPGARRLKTARAADRQALRRPGQPAARLASAPGAKFSMPGMMDTVLNLGLNDDDRRRAWSSSPATSASPTTPTAASSQMFGRIVLDIPAEDFDEQSRRAKEQRGAQARHRPQRRATCARSVDEFKADRQEKTGKDFPTDPLRAARAGHRRRVRLLERQARHRLPRLQQDPARPRHRRQHRDDGLRQHGRRLAAPASPSRATRPPARRALYGEYLTNAQGEDVVAGIRTPGQDLPDCATRCPRSTRSSQEIAQRLEQPLPRHAGPRVHHRARQALHAPDAHRQAHRAGGGEDRGRHGARGRSSPRRRRSSASSPLRSCSCCCRASTRPPRRRRGTGCWRKGLNASPGAAVGRRSSTPTARSRQRRPATQSSWCASRPARTMCTA